jgi:hypothetical protein
MIPWPEDGITSGLFTLTCSCWILHHNYLYAFHIYICKDEIAESLYW